MKRRKFITLLGGVAVASPLAARAQQTTSRTIGWFSLRSADTDSEKSILTAFRQGLSQTGYVEGRNLTIEFGFADGQYDRLPVLAADLVRRRVEVLVTAGGTNITRVAQAATTTGPYACLAHRAAQQSGRAADPWPRIRLAHSRPRRAK